MIDVDKQRVAAVRKLEALGYSYQGGEWVPAAPAAPQSLLMTAECDAMHGALMRRCPRRLHRKLKRGGRA